MIWPRPPRLPYPFIPPVDFPGDPFPYHPNPEGSSGPDDPGPRPPWWPEDWEWPPKPDEPVVIEAPPMPHTWPRLPPNHPYHLPPPYSYPGNLPPGHPGHYYPGMPPYPVVHPGG